MSAARCCDTKSTEIIDWTHYQEELNTLTTHYQLIQLNMHYIAEIVMKLMPVKCWMPAKHFKDVCYRTISRSFYLCLSWSHHKLRSRDHNWRPEETTQFLVLVTCHNTVSSLIKTSLRNNPDLTPSHYSSSDTTDSCFRNCWLQNIRVRGFRRWVGTDY